MTGTDGNEKRVAAYSALAANDPVLAAMIETHGTPDPFVWNDGGRTGTSNFAAMTLHIVGQQISITVAYTLYDRIAAATGGIPDPDTVIALGPERLRGFGLSTAKARYILDLAGRVRSGQLEIQHMDDLSDAEAVTALTAVTGVGLWSAEMFLIHQLHRQDILPAGDIGVRRAIARAWTLNEAPTIDEVRQRGQGWAPDRSYATALLRRSLTMTEGTPA
ncbi:hypothetical protein [Arthrobacter sp. NicSoilB8]|uniref:DNA-3-methyladenine glycosylase family protein n=1 Tax=Arthrobacter sp. NicSoilB8 TaxID=2830998 RepID=UPI001CC814AB|nr:hypothetical protein [Arthrobacter sp. NicSoilB8]